MKNVLTLAKRVLVPSATDAVIEKKIFRSGASVLIISNKVY